MDGGWAQVSSARERPAALPPPRPCVLVPADPAVTSALAAAEARLAAPARLPTRCRRCTAAALLRQPEAKAPPQPEETPPRAPARPPPSPGRRLRAARPVLAQAQDRGHRPSSERAYVPAGASGSLPQEFGNVPCATRERSAPRASLQSLRRGFFLSVHTCYSGLQTFFLIKLFLPTRQRF